MKETKCSFRETAKTRRNRCWRFLLPTFVCALLLACSFAGLCIDADAAVGGEVLFGPSCSGCGRSMTTDSTPATCTTPGSTTYRCASCGKSMLGESIPALGHNYTGSGCIKTCSRCSATTGSHSYSGSGCIKTCSGCGATTGSHSYSIVSEAATCTSSGISGKTVCSSCGAVGSSGTVIPPLGHSYSWSGCNGTCTRCGTSTISHSYNASGTVAATCTAQGYDLFVCSDCGASYKTNYTAKVSHSYTVAGAYVTVPTCTASGTRTYSCSYGCGNTTTKTVAATGHSPVSADTTATCTSTGTSGRKVCSTCGTETAAGTTVAKNPNNHTGSVVKAATASVCKKYSCCGASYDTTHNMTNTATSATCQTCSDCGYKDTSHNMANTGTAATHQTCSTCGYKTTLHLYSSEVTTAATCTKAGVTTHTCNCGYSYTTAAPAATGHSPNADDGNCETAIMCKTCGEITTAAKTHTYTDASDTTCNNSGCTYERTTGYTVVYNGNGHTGGSTASSTHTIDVAKALTANGFVKQYTIMYDANGGFCATSSATSAYIFLGWATSAEGSVVYSDKQSVTNIGSAGSTVNLYAVWSTSPSTVTLPTPSRPGYIFKGWFTAASGGGQVGDAGTQYTVTTTMTLYAQWTPSNYTLTYNPNGGAINPTTKSYSYGSTVSLTAPTRTGYTFKNWYFNATGTNYLNLGRQYMYTDKISIHLDAYMDDWGNFGPGDMRLISCAEGGGWNIETNNASSDGCIVFTMYDAGVGYKTVTTSIKWSSLAPGWHSFDVRFDGTKMFASVDGSVVGTSANFSSGEIGYNETNAIFVGAEAGSDASVPTSGYFTGKIANVVISDSAVFILGARNKFATPVSDVTLIADWVANTYTVVYDGNGNTGGSTESSTHTYDVAKNLTPNGFTKTGWVFAGWNTMADGSGTAYADQTSVKNLVSAADGTITLYAQWTEEAFDIIYDASSLGLPEGYKILTYIEATGTQYIKTGVKGTARWEFLIQFTDTTTRQLMGYGSSGSQYWGVQTSGKYGVQSSKTLDVVAGEKHFIIHNFGENGKYYLKKGASELTVSANDVSSQEYTLFSIGGNYFCKARLYDLRVFQNGVLIRHFVPCESPDGVVGLYDVVGQAFYTNAGTGEFVPSETYPDEYTPDLAA